VKTVFYWEPIIVYLLIFSIALLIIKKAFDSVWHVGCYDVIWELDGWTKN